MPSTTTLPHRSTSAVLRDGVFRLQVTLKLTTAILALAAGVYTYLGVRELLNGSPTTIVFAAAIYSVAVSVGIYAFWVFMMELMPHVLDRVGRGLMMGCMLLGALMIVAMWSWLNASALAGAAAIQQHLAITVQNYARDLDAANTNAIAAQSLLPRYPARVLAVCKAGRGGTYGLAERYGGIRHGRAALDSDLEPARQPWAAGAGFC